MKFNKIAKRFAVAALTGALAVSSMGISAAAAETTTATSVLTKTISKYKYAYAPNTSFTFKITPGTEQTGLTGSDGGPLASPAEGLVFVDGSATSTTGTITSTSATSDIGETSVTAGTLSLQVDSTKFSTPGVYRYEIKETEGSYEGLIYDTETKYVDVYIYSDSTEPEIIFVTASTVDGVTTYVKDDGVVTNTYDKNGDGEDPDSKLYDMTIKKTVTGNQGVSSKEFSFTITVTPNETTEEFYVTYGASDAAVTLNTENDYMATIKIADGESIIIYGLSKSDIVDIEEADYSSEGYTTYISTGSELEDYTGQTSKRSTKESYESQTSINAVKDVTVNVYNDKAATTPTGIALTIAPYALMIAIAAVVAVVFLRKRSYEA